MKITADLHLHSKYSRAVSPQMNLENMAKWAEIKGIDLMGTGDFTHPQWLSELKSNLKEVIEGVFIEKDQISKIKDLTAVGGILPESGKNQNLKLKKKDESKIKFLLTTEISSIYKQTGKCRKIHNLLIAPSISTVEKINSELKKRGCNLSSDGRPIIGLSAKDVAEIVLTVDKNCLIIPAHIWTPWFSLFGANSGFDSIEECFGEMSKYIYAVETGLSSDPQMNWNIKDLDNRSIVSFSDAHSGEKIGREATVLISQNSKLKTFCYKDIYSAIKKDKDARYKIGYTIEFYPEEGKYHYTGHLKCGVVFSTEDILKKGITCPVCGKGLTVGVTERVRVLGGLERLGKLGVTERIDEFRVRWISNKERPPFIKLVPLKEIIAEALGVGVGSKRVDELYFKLIKELGSEIEILTWGDLGPAVAKAMAGEKNGGERLAEGIKKVRSGDIFISPGYDGEFGKVKIWGNKGNRGVGGREGGEEKIKEQMGLF